MTTLIVPPLDSKPWPTLGPLVCEWIEDRLVHGPGDLRGNHYEIDAEFRAQLYRSYEIYPRDHRLAGRRRFNRVGLSQRKGTAKTEKAMAIAALELSPDAPVRCDGWRRRGSIWEPVGRPVQDPYIPLLAYTKEQTEDLGFAVLSVIIEEAVEAGRLDPIFDISQERILVVDDRGKAAGKAVPLAGSPNARDGALTTFQHFDEPHRLNSPRLVSAHTTMLENTLKRRQADPWSLETTTAGEPGQGSVAESTHQYAEDIAAGKVDEPRLFYFHRQADDARPMDTPDEVREALLEASGPAAEWSGDIDGLVTRWFEPKTDRAYYRRVWLNQWVQGGDQAFDLERWNANADHSFIVPPRSLIVAGFDGSIRRDATDLVACHIATGHKWLVGHWQRPRNADTDWEVPRGEVTEVLYALARRFTLDRLYADPFKWGPWLDQWAGRLGSKRVVSWNTTKLLPMAWAVRNFDNAIRSSSWTHNGLDDQGNDIIAQHVANARKHLVPIFDEDERQLWVIRKDRPNSDRKIDACMATILADEARNDALAAGALQKKSNKMRTR